MSKVYHIYCEGFEKCAENLADAQAFIDQLRTRGCVGKEVVVTVGTVDPKFPRAVVYDMKRSRREILRAA